ncbi:uncharacterized protein FFNC_11742 [Fusarium fujikuroi]|nr:uncharacterized protein FFNC_11742 [Fusarium fujikuroi]
MATTISIEPPVERDLDIEAWIGFTEDAWSYFIQALFVALELLWSGFQGVSSTFMMANLVPTNREHESLALERQHIEKITKPAYSLRLHKYQPKLQEETPKVLLNQFLHGSCLWESEFGQSLIEEVISCAKITLSLQARAKNKHLRHLRHLQQAPLVKTVTSAQAPATARDFYPCHPVTETEQSNAIQLSRFSLWGVQPIPEPDHLSDSDKEPNNAAPNITETVSYRTTPCVPCLRRMIKVPLEYIWMRILSHAS